MRDDRIGRFIKIYRERCRDAHQVPLTVSVLRPILLDFLEDDIWQSEDPSRLGVAAISLKRLLANNAPALQLVQVIEQEARELHARLEQQRAVNEDLVEQLVMVSDQLRMPRS